jgi:hypothetical protein
MAVALKGLSREIFDLYFFDQTSSPEPLFHTLLRFLKLLRIRQDNGVRDDSAMETTFFCRRPTLMKLAFYITFFYKPTIENGF